MGLNFDSLRGRLMLGKTKGNGDSYGEKSSMISRLGKYLMPKIRKSAGKSMGCVDDEDGQVHDAVVITLSGPMTASVVEIIPDSHQAEDLPTLDTSNEVQPNALGEGIDGTQLNGGGGCYWASIIDQVCAPVSSHSTENFSENIITKSDVSGGEVQSEEVSNVPPPPTARSPSTSSGAEQGSGRRLSSATTLLCSSTSGSPIVKSPRQISTGDFQEEPSHVDVLAQSNSVLSAKVEELRAELKLVQARLDHSETEHIYKVYTATLETAMDDAQSREDALRKEVEDGQLRENELSRFLEETQSREEMLITYVQEQAQLIGQARQELNDAKSWGESLNRQLKEQVDRECESQITLSSQLEGANQDRDWLRSVVEEVFGRERRLKERLEQEEEGLQELKHHAENLQRELESTRHDAAHRQAENKALQRFVFSFQDDTIFPEDGSGRAIGTGTDCEACTQLTRHLSHLKRVNLSMAKKLKDYRFTVETKVEQLRRCQAWAEGRPEEKEIEAHELVKRLEKELRDVKAANVDLCRHITREMKEAKDAKARADLEVDRLTKLCDFRDVQMASMETDNTRVDSLQLHNAELLDAISQPQEGSTIFEHQRQSFAEEILALTTRANTYEAQAQMALENEATRRLEIHDLSSELAQLKEFAEKGRADKAQIDLELEKIRFREASKADEKSELEIAYQEAISGLKATIQSLRDERGRFLMMIPEDMTALDQYYFQIKCWEIENLREDIQSQSDQIKQLQDANNSNAYYATAYESLEAQLNSIDEVRDNKEAGKIAFDRALRGVLEDEFGHVDQLYRQAGERMRMEGERETFEREAF